MSAPATPFGGDAGDVVAQPLRHINSLFAHAVQQGGIDAVGDSDFGVSAHFEAALAQPGLLDKIPCIHLADCNLDHLRPNSLVQDMFNPEYYVGAYKEPEDATWRMNKYTDVGGMPSEAAETRLLERKVFICVPVPGESAWLQASDARPAAPSFPPASSSRGKRGRGGESDEDVSMSIADSAGASAAGAGDVADSLDSKRVRPRDGEVAMVPEDRQTGDADAAPRIASPENRRCMVKLYGQGIDLKLNEVADIIGVLACDPTAATFGQGAGGPFLEEDEAHNPPPSQVPRLHAILVQRAPSHPALGSDNALPAGAALGELRAAAPALREAAIAAFAAAVGGDALVGELLLLHTLSRVHSRIEPIALGALSLGLTGVGKAEVAALLGVLQAVLPRVVHLPLSIPALNRSHWAPRKDYTLNVLAGGPLQAAEGTALVVDETTLETGLLTQVGIDNLSALKEVIQGQRVNYDFQYYLMNMNTDMKVLTLAEKKSLLPADVSVRVSATREAAAVGPSAELLGPIRNYLGVAAHLPHSIGQSVSKAIEDDLVSARAENKQLGQEHFHRWLTTARLVAQSFGEGDLTEAHWRHTRDLERRVQERMRVC